jgi:hypothetical protein
VTATAHDLDEIESASVGITAQGEHYPESAQRIAERPVIIRRRHP